MNLLVIAPETKGLFVPDVQQFISELEANRIRGDVLAGKVTLERIRARFSGDPYDILLWIGHGLPGLLQLYEDSVSAKWLKDQLERCPRCKLVRLISCYGAIRQAGDVLSSFTDALPSLGIDVIAMGNEITEAAALVYTTNFLVKYYESGDVRLAHTLALDRVLFSKNTSGAAVVPELHRGDKVVPSTSTQLEARVGNLESQVNLLKSQVLGIQRRQHPPNLVVVLRIVLFSLLGSLFLSLTFEEVRTYYVKNPFTSLVILGLALGLLAALATLVWFILREDN